MHEMSSLSARTESSFSPVRFCTMSIDVRGDDGTGVTTLASIVRPRNPGETPPSCGAPKCGSEYALRAAPPWVRNFVS